MNEPIRIAIFELTIIASSVYASNVMKIDIVNPIPARKPVALIIFQLTFSGKADTFNLTARYEKNTIPQGLPITSPRIIPKLPADNRF